MSTHTAESPISPTLQAILDLFSEDLAAVRFPDMDREVLAEAARRVVEQAAAQAQAEARLQATREALQDSQEALLHKCQRALAYARVYAEEDPDLGRKLEGLSLPRPRGKVTAPPPESEGRRPLAPGRRGRRASAQSGALFLEVPPDGGAALEAEASA